MESSFTSKNSTKSFLLDEAVKLGADKDEIESCLDNGTYKSKVQTAMQIGASTFGVTGTP